MPVMIFEAGFVDLVMRSLDPESRHEEGLQERIYIDIPPKSSRYKICSMDGRLKVYFNMSDCC